MDKTKLLDKGQIAEVKDLYAGSWGSVRELAGLFNVSTTVIRYLVNYKNYRQKSKEYSNDWRMKNPEKFREIVKKAGRKYQQSENGKAKIKKRDKKRWLELKASPAKHRKFLKRCRECYYRKKIG